MQSIHHATQPRIPVKKPIKIMPAHACSLTRVNPAARHTAYKCKGSWILDTKFKVLCGLVLLKGCDNAHYS